MKNLSFIIIIIVIIIITFPGLETSPLNYLEVLNFNEKNQASLFLFSYLSLVSLLAFLISILINNMT